MTPPSLFQPISIRALEVRNRLWVSPMCQYSVFGGDGVPTDWHLVHLGSFARGGAGLVMAEATGVSPDGRITHHDTGLWNDAQAEAWSRIVAFVKGQGAAVGIQLGHAGRKASAFPDWSIDRVGTVPPAEGGWAPTAPSPIPIQGHAVPRALAREEIAQVIADFAAAARRAVAAGFDVVEIHGAHGYLLHEFLSPISNQRDDEYGGSLANRARIVLEVVHAVRGAIGDVPLFLRLSGTDWVAGGWTIEETIELARWASEAGVDFFDISSGGNVTGAQIPVGPGYQVPLARHVKDGARVPVSAVGLITDPLLANQVVVDGEAEAVMVGREFMRDPHFGLHAAAALGVRGHWPPQYVQAQERLMVASR